MATAPLALPRPTSSLAKLPPPVWARIPASLDGRTDLYAMGPHAPYTRDLAIDTGRWRWRRVVALWHREHVRWVLLDRRWALAQELQGRPGWSCQQTRHLLLCPVPGWSP